MEIRRVDGREYPPRTLYSIATTVLILSNLTSYSGKRTCATTLYQAGVAEDLIMDHTGHRSIQGVHTYKRPSLSMIGTVSQLVEPPISSTKEI